MQHLVVSGMEHRVAHQEEEVREERREEEQEENNFNIYKIQNHFVCIYTSPGREVLHRISMYLYILVISSLLIL